MGKQRLKNEPDAPPAIRPKAVHIESRMSRCVWFGGQDWVGPRMGGQARIRSHRTEDCWWVGADKSL
jgi:hypothetical protein